MLRSICFSFIVALSVALSMSACSTSADHTSQGTQGAQESGPAAAGEATCEHGVDKALCTRCNPKLAPAFKAKGDWCPEHDRPESQCVLCNPELAKKGVK